jgi:outer membrane receptor protein involved in Fe transport
VRSFSIIKRILLLTAALFSMLALVHAQDAASLTGKITDEKDNSPLIGANIVITGTSKGAAADIEGIYSIPNIKPGVYTLEVTYIGYKKTILTAIKLKAGEKKVLNIKLTPTLLTLDQEVVIVGEKPLVDVDQSKTQNRISNEKIEAAPVRELSQLLNTQAGVINSPIGINIRGGRTYETGFYIDGVSAKDPLSGTGFGVDVGSNAMQELEINTGGIDVEYGNSTSGTVNTKTKSGGEKLEANILYKRDNLGFNESEASCFNQDVFELSLGGPSKLIDKVTPGNGKFRYYTSLRYNLGDTYIKYNAEQLVSSIEPNTFWSPKQDNRWSGFVKLNYDFSSKNKLTLSYLKSLTVNQDLNMLRVTGNDVSFKPGYQFQFQLMPDNASTFSFESNLETIKWNSTPNNRFSYQVQLSRLFVHLRGDANGRPWRPNMVNTEFDPESIREFPSTYFNPDDSIVFTLASPGLFNNGGISTLWHDHIVEEYTAKAIGYLYSKDTRNRLTIGLEYKHQYLQWIDITKPWIGAPIQLADSTYSQSFRLGELSDIWRVKPATGAIFISDKYKFMGLIADVGGRLEFWAPGTFVDEAVADPESPIVDEIRESYMKNTVKIFGKRYKIRLLPKISASFPVKENQVMYFSYGQSSILPHPSYVYTGLNPEYTDRSTLSYIGNPDLNPEMDISYELGLRSQITSDDAINISAFWKDKYDFITSASIQVKDVNGKEVTRTIRINSDYARIRGAELTYIKRVKKWYRGQISLAYMTATGQSASSSEDIEDILNTGNREDTKEYPLPWDRPVDLKSNNLFILDQRGGLFGVKPINKIKFYFELYYRSGMRYTPYVLTGYEPYSGRPIYEMSPDPNDRYSEIGKDWFGIDINFMKYWNLKNFEIALNFEITNLLNNLNATIINPVTGRGYEYGDDVPTEWRDPRYNDPRDPRSDNIPPDNPSRYNPQRHFMVGLVVKYR